MNEETTVKGYSVKDVSLDSTQVAVEKLKRDSFWEKCHSQDTRGHHVLAFTLNSI
jgi:hypothetical protein